MSTNRVWITWEKQRRNEGISSALGAKLYEILCEEGVCKRYLKSTWRTARILIRENPDLVIVQNPSLILATLAVILKPLLRYRCVVDAHNAGLFPLEGRSSLLNFLSNELQRRADLTIVTNEWLAEVVRRNRGRAAVLPDKIPQAPVTAPFPLEGTTNIALVCSFGSDEPFAEVVEAARYLPEGILIYVTGQYQGKVEPDTLPANMRLTGYLSEVQYWSLLGSADGVMVLTKRDDCLVCGAYEALAVEKPMILSDTKTLRGYFSKGGIYTASKAEDIREAVVNFCRIKEQLAGEVATLKEKLSSEWDCKLSALRMAIAVDNQ